MRVQSYGLQVKDGLAAGSKGTAHAAVYLAYRFDRFMQRDVGMYAAIGRARHANRDPDLHAKRNVDPAHADNNTELDLYAHGNFYSDRYADRDSNPDANDHRYRDRHGYAHRQHYRIANRNAHHHQHLHGYR